MAERPAVNASPLIFLSKGGLLDMLRLASEEVVGPAPVATEIQRRGPTDLTIQAIERTDWLVVVESPPIPGLIQAWNLGEGESSVLAWPMPIQERRPLWMIWPRGAVLQHSEFPFEELWV